MSARTESQTVYRAAAVDVHVDEHSSATDGTSSTTSPGFGVPAAVAAVAGSVALWHRVSAE